jgi:DNA processing protein
MAPFYLLKVKSSCIFPHLFFIKLGVTRFFSKAEHGMPHAKSPLSDKERLARLRLARTNGVGSRTFFSLLEIYGSAERALERVPDLSRRGGGVRPIVPASADAVLSEERKLRAIGGRFLLFGEAPYPPLLAQIPDAPPLLSYVGDEAWLGKPKIAVVGARNASASGCRFTASLARTLGETGNVIVSGLARGIDGAAHQAALETGTIAVVAGGVDHIYPPEHKELHEAIARQGGVVAEMPFGSTPQAKHFPRRNRIISGLCGIVVAVEAGMRSGSLITARFALEQNRELCAVPGSPLDPRCQGTNDLLKKGAHPVTGAEDVLSLLRNGGELCESEAPAFHIFARLPEPQDGDVDAARPAVLERMGPAPEEIEEIARRANVSVRVATVVVLELELAGKIERYRGNKVALVYEPTDA